MPVILLDPALPDLIPVRAVSLMAGHVYVTEDVNPALLWNISSYEFAGGERELPPGAVVLSSDRSHPLVLHQLSRGDEVIAGDQISGTRLLSAVALMDRLRRTGPWERQQTHDSLRRYLLEEVYELLDAFDKGDNVELKSELGDLLLQVLFHSRIAEDSAEGAFSIDDVAQSFVDKVSYRTPGILSGEHADLQRQIDEWEERKAAERNRGSVLDGLVTSQPSLALTQKLFERLATAHFPRDAISPSLTRVDIPIRKHARDSAEDQQRRRVLQLMDQVYAAEQAAALDGVTPRHEDAWRKYLGMSYDESSLVVEAVETSTVVETSSPVEPVETPVFPLGTDVSVVEPSHSVAEPSHSVVESLSVVEPSANEVSRRVETTHPDDDDHEHSDPWSEEYISNFATAAPGATHDTLNDFDHEFDAEHRASGFPEAEDFPGPPAPPVPPSPPVQTRPMEFVDADPIKKGDRQVNVSYDDHVPGMVVRSEWDDEDD